MPCTRCGGVEVLHEGKMHGMINANKHGKVRIITIDQHDAINEFITSTDVKPIKQCARPMVDYKDLTSDDTLLEGMELHKFQSEIGSCNYFAITTRYDISYAMSRICSQKPTKGARKALNRVIVYLMSTSDFNIRGIWGLQGDEVQMYSDSDHAGCMQVTTCSQTGGIIILNNVPIRWKSKKQPKTSKSSAQAEIYALSDMVGEGKHIAHIMEESNIKINWPISIHVDNMQAKKFSESVSTTSRLRNTFNLSESWIQELRDEGKIKILHMNSQNNPADLFTKLHSMSRFKYLLKCINCITYKNDE